MSTSEILTLVTPLRNILLAIAACSAGLVLGLWFVGQPENAVLKLWSTICIAVSGLGLIPLALQLCFPPRLILTSQGSRLTGLVGVPLDGNLCRNLSMAPEPLAALMEEWWVRYGE